jgi:hypothetical protein
LRKSASPRIRAIRFGTFDRLTQDQTRGIASKDQQKVDEKDTFNGSCRYKAKYFEEPRENKLLLAGSPRHRVRVRVLHFKEEKIFYPRGMVDNLRALYQAGSDAPEENPPSPRTNPEVTKLQQNL